MTGSKLAGLLGEFRKEIGWTAVVLVLAALAVVALLPSQPAHDGRPSSDVRPVDPALRQAARVEPCSSGSGTRAQLAGAAGTCLADGTSADLSALAAGPAVINVWATWCAPCRVEMPALQEYSTQPGALRVIGVQVESDEAGGLDLVRQLGVHFPSVHDDGRHISAALKLPPALPATYVVTPAGEVRRVDPPVVFRSPDEVRAVIERSLGAGR